MTPQTQMSAPPSHRVLSRRTRPTSFSCLRLTRYRSRRSGLSVIGIAMPVVGLSAPGAGNIPRSPILDPKEPIERLESRNGSEYCPLLTRLTSRRGVWNFDEFSRFHVVDIAVYRNVIGNQWVVSDAQDILDDALRIV